MHLRFRRLEEVILLDMIRYPQKRFLLQIGAFLADLALLIVFSHFAFRCIVEHEVLRKRGNVFYQITLHAALLLIDKIL